jgi:hypothetical protein
MSCSRKSYRTGRQSLVGQPCCNVGGLTPLEYCYTTAQFKDVLSLMRGSTIEEYPRDHQMKGGAVTRRGTLAKKQWL